MVTIYAVVATFAFSFALVFTMLDNLLPKAKN